MPEPHLTRRDLLERAAGGLALAALSPALASLAEAQGADPRTRYLHHPPKAKQVLQLFMNGGVSQMDTFDYKPELARRHGQQIDFGIKAAATSIPGAIMKSPFSWKQHGESGRWVSSALPDLAQHVDEMAFLMAMTTKSNVHGPASYMQNTGFLLPGFPCMGAWISYALGPLNPDLPAFVVLPDPRGLPYNNAGNFSAGFLPAAHAGTIIRPNAKVPIANLEPPSFASQIDEGSERDGLALLQRLNRRHLERHPGDSRLEARIQSYDLVPKMERAAPEILDLSSEPEPIRQLYGIDQEPTAPFARNCLIARRLLEHGARVVQVWSGMGGPKENWDNHNDIPSELSYIAQRTDRPMAALLADLKQRGMLEDVLVVWSTEFGRMPFTQGATGRDHNGGTFVTWLAGAGIRRGVSYGESDELGYQAAEGKTYCYDLHATILHLLGIDHERLTFRHDGIDRRLTDVHGHVIREILA